ncbi:hypothetical protein CLAFUW4_13396 [Fulvia fulva]|nr:hypothetical protein CLAFUR4_13400 [Fulvia fulva]WPV21171.1 hypothetical protein CLAFUW4_13396 [Fulvia fulva]WPV35846.1 hypothetical protein CLAFUW7_13403 [Fulvia fulva]
MGISAHLWFSLAPLRLRLTIYPAHRISAGPTSSTQKPQSDLNTRVQQTTILPATMQRIARFFSRKKPDHQSTEVLFDHDQTLHAQENSTPPVKPSSDLSQETFYNEVRRPSLADSEDSTCQSTITLLSSTHYFLKKLGNGIDAAVYAIIPRDFADSFVAGLTDATPKDVALDVLRKAVIAVKVANGPLTGPGNAKAAMETEIRALKALGNGRMLDCDEGGGTWCTMLMITGGTLQQFYGWLCRQVTHKPMLMPKCLVYHLLTSLAEALLALHAKGITHGDLHPGNIMLRPKPSSDCYPDVVIVDFGHAAISPKSKRLVRWREVDDFESMSTCLAIVFDVEEVGFLHSFARRIREMDGGETPQSVLGEVVECAGASRQRWQRLENPVPSAMGEYLAGTTITDGELERTILGLEGRW